MPDDYFDVHADDANFGDRWFLGDPLTAAGDEIDPRLFTEGRKYNGPPPVYIPIQVAGRPVNFHFASFDMPVISNKVGDIIQEIAPQEVERFPVKVNSHLSGYEILNVLGPIECLDESRSEVMKWEEDDGSPDMIGKYRMITSLTIDPARTRGRYIFRIRGWEIALI